MPLATTIPFDHFGRRWQAVVNRGGACANDYCVVFGHDAASSTSKVPFSFYFGNLAGVLNR